MLEINAGAALTFGLLTAAIAALWLPWRPGRVPGGATWLAVLCAATVSAHTFGFITWRGVLALSALGFAAHAAGRQGGTAGQRGVATVITAGLAAGLMVHAVPGFANPRVLAAQALSSGAMPYSKYLNFDKAGAGVLLVAFAGAGLATTAQWRRILGAVALAAPATAFVLLALSGALGYVAWEPGWPPILLFWAWTNLAFTCVAEEALFRGLLQKQLAAGLARYRYGATVALGAGALLFGLAHFAGGWRYVLLSTVGGLGYGWAYQRSGRLEASIATHFLVNLVHFTLFTYPALAPG